MTVRLFDVLDADMQMVVERVGRVTARRLVREGCAVWCGDRPAIRQLRNDHRLRDQSALPGPRVIEANAAGAEWARDVTNGWAPG